MDVNQAFEMWLCHAAAHGSSADGSPETIAGYRVEAAVDTARPMANVLEYRLAGGHKLMIRSSGTDPKIKVYLFAVGDREATADEINERLSAAAAELVTSR